MPRPPIGKVPFPAFKGRVGFQHHKIPRDEFFDNPAVRYPIYNRLPESWRKEYEKKPRLINQKFPEATKRPQEKGLWFVNSEGRPELFNIAPIRPMYTKEVREGLWGGEGIIKGHKYPDKIRKYTRDKMPSEKTWRPVVKEESFHSEILNKTIITTVTPRTLDLIDAAYGFDHYILKTPMNELCSDLGGKLKREMLLQLLDKDSMYPNDTEKQEKIYNRYKKYILPREEAEWVGHTLKEAMLKQWNDEKNSGVHDSVPLLDIYTKELKEKLKLNNSETVHDVNSGTPVDSVVIFEAPAKEAKN